MQTYLKLINFEIQIRSIHFDIIEGGTTQRTKIISKTEKMLRNHQTVIVLTSPNIRIH